ncbi:MAG: CarD family transcriptional regulator [Peptococcaceae bacterium]|nr:CarD family transcriptional regulator [Peptococcaceae bacterium]
MFEIGDKIVYPMHGAGVIEAIEEREILGEAKRYYVLKMPIGEMRVLVPIGSVGEIGLRRIIHRDALDQVFEILQKREELDQENWNRRYRHNLEKLKSGSVFDLAEVVRNLACRDKVKGLSTGEKKMFDNARQLLLSELVLVTDGREDNIVGRMDACLTG